MSETKKVVDWEREKQQMVKDLGKHDLAQDTEITEDQFMELILAEETAPVFFEDRIKFLKENSYDVTRANMLDSSLSKRTFITEDQETTDNAE